MSWRHGEAMDGGMRNLAGGQKDRDDASKGDDAAEEDEYTYESEPEPLRSSARGDPRRIDTRDRGDRDRGDTRDDAKKPPGDLRPPRRSSAEEDRDRGPPGDFGSTAKRRFREESRDERCKEDPSDSGGPPGDFGRARGGFSQDVNSRRKSEKDDARAPRESRDDARQTREEPRDVRDVRSKRDREDKKPAREDKKPAREKRPMAMDEEEFGSNSGRGREKEQAEEAPLSRRRERDDGDTRRPDRDEDEALPRRRDRDEGEAPPRRRDRDEGEAPPRRRDRDEGEAPPRRRDRDEGEAPPRRRDRDEGEAPPRRRDLDEGDAPPRRRDREETQLALLPSVAVDDPDPDESKDSGSESADGDREPLAKRRRPFESAPQELIQEENFLPLESVLMAHEPQTSQTIPVPSNMVDALFMQHHHRLLMESSGSTMEYEQQESHAVVRGSVEQVKNGMRILHRVMMHCRWGCSAEKIARILKPRVMQSVVCRLSPMHLLPAGEKKLSATTSTMSVGKEKGHDVVVPEAVVSRVHCILELDPERGGVYVMDHSTNGTWLNGVRLPKADQGKVVVSHGDEILLKDPAAGVSEYGYIVNLQEPSYKTEVPLTYMPRRMLDKASGRHDTLFSAQQLRREPPKKDMDQLTAPKAKERERQTNMTGARLASKLGIKTDAMFSHVRLPGEADTLALAASDYFAAASCGRGAHSSLQGVCSDFMAGKCMRGRACKYSHSAPGLTSGLNAVELASGLAADLARARAALPQKEKDD